MWNKEEISKVGVHRKQKDRGHPKTRNGRTSKEGAKCKFYDQIHPFRKSSYPAWGSICTKCKHRNHFAVLCRAGKTGSHCKKSRVYAVGEDNSAESECEIISTVRETVNAVSDDKKPIQTYIEIHKQIVTFHVNHGAKIKVVTLRAVKSIALSPTRN